MLHKLKTLLSAARHTFHSLPAGRVGVGAFLSLIFLASCSETDNTWDPYANWKERNAAWYEQISDSARTAIAEAKAKYGDDWETHCVWRRFKTLRKAQDYDSHLAVDSVCVRIVQSGTREGAVSPYANDTIRCSYRGWLMPTQYQNANGELYDDQLVFDQTYYGAFDEETAAPALMPLAATAEGFYTALQYMVPGDDWYVYIPQQLGYGAAGKGSVQAYSTMLFRVHLTAVYRAGTGVPSWK